MSGLRYEGVDTVDRSDNSDERIFVEEVLNMEITRTARRPSSGDGIKLWHCERCGKVHLAARESIASLNREEFASFIQAAVEIHYSSWDAMVTDRAEGEIVGTFTDSVH
ncbi:MAG: hypothetical protein K1X36_05695 [Pyrinomonadaceae bacterium]|nr:hypothetical protein [Pyrinomonadaceae bacterium]